jgi:hypothetical protein
LNEKIKQIAKEAGFTTCTKNMQEMLERFAYNITRECAKNISEWIDIEHETNPYWSGYNHAIADAVVECNLFGKDKESTKKKLTEDLYTDIISTGGIDPRN